MARPIQDAIGCNIKGTWEDLPHPIMFHIVRQRFLVLYVELSKTMPRLNGDLVF